MMKNCYRKMFRLFSIGLILLLAFGTAAQNPSGTSGTALLVSPAPVYFGQIPLSSSSSRDILIFNTGTQAATISAINITGTNAADFAITGQQGSTTLNPLEILIVSVQFTPSVSNGETAMLQVVSNLGTDSDSLQGRGTPVSGSKTTFERIIGSPQNDGGSAVTMTSDGGYIITGQTIPSANVDFPDAYAVKTDQYGKVLWAKNYGGQNSEQASDVIQTADGGYLFAGSTDSFGAGVLDGYLIKTDSQGVLQWSNTYGGNQDDVFHAVIATADGGFLAVGSSIKPGTQDRDAFMVKVDNLGNEQWNKRFGGSGGENAFAVLQTGDHGFIFAGSTTSFGAGNFDVYLVKTDSVGVEQWSKTYGGPDLEEAAAMDATSDGGYILAGFTSGTGAGGRDMYLIKTDGNGNLVWSNTFGFTHNDGASAVKQTPDGGYIIAGSTVTTVTQQKQFTDGYVVKADANGNKIWDQLYGSSNNEEFADVQLSSDGRYVLAGSTTSYSKDSDVYFLKIADQGGVTNILPGIQTIPESFELSQNYPNPFNSQTLIQYVLKSNSFVTLKIYDVLGREVATLANGQQAAGVHVVHFDADKLATGIYYYRLSTGNFSRVKKMLLVK